MTSERVGHSGSYGIPEMPWVQGPESRPQDTGNNAPLIGMHDAEADLRAKLKYFGIKDADGNVEKYAALQHVEVPNMEEPTTTVWTGLPSGQKPLVEIDPDTFEDHVADVFDAAQILMLRKHKDYGPKNISMSPGGPLNGLRVRMWDKMARINNLIDSGATPENESLRDSFLDLLNYSAIALLVLDGTWPDE